MYETKAKRHNNESTYKITTDRATYAVTLEGLKNTAAGQPRYKARITTLCVKGEENNANGFYTRVYTFYGHYTNEATEAGLIVNYMENEIYKKGE